MKRSEMVLAMERFHAIRYCMVEGGYITMKQYQDELLAYLQEKGMLPPPTLIQPMGVWDCGWDLEDK